MKLSPENDDSPRRRRLTSPEVLVRTVANARERQLLHPPGQIWDLKANFMGAITDTLGALRRGVGRDGQASAAAWRGWIDSAA